jgi:hypothetical protein
MQKVIQHLMDFLMNHLSSEDKQELLGLIEDYRRGLVPLIVPLTLLKLHLNRHPVPDWVHQQVYLHPSPRSSCCAIMCRPGIGHCASGGLRIRIRVVRLGSSCRLSLVLQASEPMQKVVQHLLDFLTNRLSSEDKVYRR